MKLALIKNRSTKKSARKNSPLKTRFLSTLFPIAALVLGLSSPSPVSAVNESFTFNPALAIPDGNVVGTQNTQTPASLINVIQGVTVNLNIAGVPANLGYNTDLYVYLQHITPGGSGITVLLNRVGLTTANPVVGYPDSGVNILLSDAAATDVHLYRNQTIPAPGTQLTGTFQADGRNISPLSTGAQFDAAARTTLASAFNGLSAKGGWTLFLADVSGGNQHILNSWSLNLSGIAGPFYWKGGQNGLWSTIGSGGTTNWAADVAGTTGILATPDSTADVIFSTTNASNRITTLNADFTIKSLAMSDTLGAVQINGGGVNTLTIAGNAGTGIDVQAGALGLTIGANVTLAGLSDTITVNNAAGASITGILGGANGLTKAGTGTLTLGGANNYTGATVVSGGILEIAASAGTTALGSAAQGTTVNSGAALRLLANAGTGSEPITLIGNGVGGTGGALIIQPGVSIIGGPVTVGGAAGASTTITAGAGASAFFTGGINKDARTLVFDGRGGGQFFVTTNPITGATSFTSDFVVNGGSTTFSVANSYAGTTWIGNGGTLFANVLGALPSLPGDGGIAGVRTLVVMDPDTLANFPGAPAALVPPGSTAPSTLSLGANQAIQSLASPNTAGIGASSLVFLGNQTLTIGTAAGSTTFFGVITSGVSGGLTKDGASTQILAGNNTYTGATLVGAGHLQIGVGGVAGTPGNLSGASAVTVNPGAFLDLNLANNGIFSNNVANSGTVRGINLLNNTQTFSGVITGIGNLLQNVEGVTILTNINTYQGGTVIGNGTNTNRPQLQVGSGAQQGSVGTGNVTFNGGGALILVNVNGGVFANNVSNSTVGNAVFRQNEAVGVTTTITGAITSAGGGQNLHFWQTGAGTTILTNAGNIYTSQFIDNTTIQAGILQIGTDASPSLAGANVAGRYISVTTGGTLILKNIVGNTLNNNIANTFGPTGTVFVDSLNNNTLNGAITAFAGTIDLHQIGSGSTTLTNAGNGINGGVTVTAGSLIIGTGALPSQIDAGGAAAVGVGTNGVLTLVNLVGNVMANNITNGIGGTGLVNVNSANTNTLSGILSNGALGTLALTQQSAGTTNLTGNSTYTGATNVNSGTLQIGNNVSGNITSPQINVAGGATLGVNLATGATLPGNIANAGTVNANIAAGTQALSGAISGLGVFNHTGAGITDLIGVSNYTGATTVTNGTLRVNGALGNTAVTVQTGATLGGNGTIGGVVSVQAGGHIAAGNSPGTLTFGGLLLVAGSNSDFELGVPGVVGQASLPGNDLFQVNGNLTLAGNLNVTPIASFGPGSYRLFNYTGVLTPNATTVNGVPGPLTSQVYLGVTGQVNLLVLNSAVIGAVQFWDGAGPANDNAIAGGNGSWDGFLGNWTNGAGNPNAAWQNGVANFGAAAGTVTLASTVSAQGLVFATNGYQINGAGAFTLNLVAGPAPVPFITVSPGLTATINAQITGANGLTADGAGTLVLTSVSNSYTGGTTVTLGTVSISSDNNLGNAAGALTLNNGTLQTTATFASGRGVTVTGNGTFDVTNANVFTANGVIGGAGALTKINTGTLVLGNAGNTYNGPTNILDGTVRIFANGNLGAVAGGITFGGSAGSNAILQTTAAVALGNRAVTLNLGGGTIDTNGFNSSLAGVISGAAGNALTKAGAGTLTLTGASTYLGQTNVNGGTLQVGNGVVAGTQIGNNTANVVVANGATLAINLANNGIFGNTVTNNGGGTVTGNNTAGNTQTFSGVISGAGVLTQSGAGTTILTAANTYSGTTTAAFGTLQIGNGVAVGASIVNSVSTTVNGGAALAIHLLNGETFINNVTDNGAVNGVNTGANVQTLSGNIIGSGTLNQTGTGTTILTGANSYQGVTTIAAGTLQIGAGGTIGTLGSGNVTDNGALIFNRSNLMTVANTINGSGTVTQQGTGTTILTATNGYTGATTVAFGTLQIGDGATAGSSIAGSTATTVNVGATLAINLANNEIFINNVTDNGAVNGISVNTQTLSGVISGTGALNQNGIGKTILTGNNNYTGATTINAGTLQVGAGGVTGSLGNGGNVLDNGALIFNRSDAITVANVITGSGTLAQQGAGTTTLTGADTYAGVTSVNNGTLQIGDGTAGNIQSGQINVALGSTFALNLANNQTLPGNIANLGTINSISANTQTFAGNISGTGVFNQTGAGITIMTGASTYTGATTVVNGNLRVNGSLGNTAVTVQSGATLSGTGSIAGTVTILGGGNLNPGTSPGTLTTGTMFLNAGSNLNYELGVPGVIGQAVLPGNDLVKVNGNLTLDGNLNVTPLAGFGSGSYRLFNYTGTLTNNTVDNINGVGAAFTPVIVTAVANQVNLLVLANGIGPVQFWDGDVPGTANNNAINGGNGSWNNFTANWTDGGGTANASWQNGTAIFLAPSGTVTITETVNAQGLIFGANGYVINGAGAGTLNLVGQNPAVPNVPFISVTAAGDTATINALITNSIPGFPAFTNGLFSTGAGRLVLTNNGNTYTGGTTISGGGTVSISNDQNLGAIPGAPGINDITLNNGVLQSTATFALNTNRGITLAGAGGIDVTGANRFTVGSIIAGPGSLSKTGTGILTLSGANTYGGGTLILGGTLEISNDGNLGNIAGNVTFGNGATLKTLAGINSARAISLGAVANTGGGVIDTNGFNSTLTGIITGAAGNGLVKNGAGILTVTGASTYLGVTTINTGTLQVGDNATAGAQIGNNAANVIVGAGAVLDVRLTNGGTFNNTIATALGATINSTNNAAATQTFGGVISGAGIFNQNGLGTAVLNGANTYTGQTNVNFGTVILGHATALGTIAAGTVVASGATLDLNGQTVGAEALTIGGAGVGGNGALVNGNIAVGASLSGPVTLTADTTITTFSANLNATPGGSILLSGNISGGFGIIKNGNGTLTLTGLNIYTGVTQINAGILQAGNNFALGSVGTPGNPGGTVVVAGASLQLLNGVAIVGEPLTINGFGAGVAAPGALTQSLNGSTSFSGPITVASNANISTNGTGIMTLTGGITKNGTTLTLNGGGTININGVGINGATIFTSDLVIDGTGVGGLTVVNLNAASSYAGPTWITNGGTLNANVAGALPSLVSDGGIAAIRTTVIMDPIAAIPGTPPSPFPSAGGSILNLGASQAIQSLTGAVSSRVNLGTNTLTIGTNLVSNTTFAGVISGANAAGVSIIKDGTSTQIFGGPGSAGNTYTGATNVNGGILQAGVLTTAFGVNSPVTIGAAGTLDIAGFSNTIGSLAGAAGGVVQSTGGVATLTTGALNTSTNYAGVLLDGAGGQLLLIKNGTGTQTLSGPAGNTFTGLTLVNAGQLDLNKATGFNAIGGNLTIGDGAAAPNTDIVRLLNSDQIIDTSAVLIHGSSGRLDLNNFNETIASFADTGAVIVNGSSVNLGSGTLTFGDGNNLTFSGAITGVNGNLIKNGLGTQTFAGTTTANTFSGLTTVNSGELDLNKTAGTLAIGGNLTIGDGLGGANNDIVKLLASNQIIDTSAVLIHGSSGRLDLNNFNETIASFADTGAVIVNGSSVNLGGGTLTFGDVNNLTFSGAITGAGGSLIKNGTGTQTFAGTTTANTFSGVTTVNAGQLDLNKSDGTQAIGGHMTIGDGAGGANSDIVRLLNNNQIIDTSRVSINGSSGRLDLNNFNETIAWFADTGVVTVNGSSVNLGNGTLTFGNASNQTFSGAITGAGGNLIKNGTGTQTFAGTTTANTFNGLTTVNAGQLDLNKTAGTLAIGGNLTIGDGAGGANSDIVRLLQSNQIADASVVQLNATTGRLDLNNQNETVGSIASTGAFTLGGSTINLGTGALTTGGNNGTTAFSGVITGAGGTLTKEGTGNFTLTGANTFTGPVTVNDGTLSLQGGAAIADTVAVTVNDPAGAQFGTLNVVNSETIGSLAGNGNATLNAQTLITGGNGTSTLFSGTVSGAGGALVKNGAGTFTLTGTNTYTGGTTLNAGTLAAGSMKAFGSGNLTINGGTVQTVNGPRIVDLGGGTIAANAGTAVFNVGGTTAGVTHDQVRTTGNVTFAGIGSTVALVRQNLYLLAPGDKVNLVIAVAGVQGGTANGTPYANVTGLAQFSNTPLLVPAVNLYTTAIVLEAMQGSFAGLGGVFNGAGQFIPFTPNQLATAGALDSLIGVTGGKTGIIKELNFLDTQALGTLPGNLDKIAPEELTAMFTNAVALANIQSANLGRRMEDIRNSGPTGSASGLAAAGSGPAFSGGLNGPEGKRSREIAPPSEERWGVFLTGSGEFTRVGSTTNAAGYRFETGGVTGGLDYRVNDKFAIGLDFGYVGTNATLANGGSMDTQGGRVGLYATYFHKNFHVDAAVNGGLNSYKTTRVTPNSTVATGSPNGSEINILVSAGYDWKIGKFTVGPTASYQYTNVHLNGFTEAGTFLPLTIASQNTESSRSSFGFHATYDTHVGSYLVRPEVRASWQHEFGTTASTITSRFANVGGNPFTVAGPKIGRDSILIGAGVSVQWSPSWATYLYYDGEVGRTNYDSHNISGGFRAQF